ncbi:MAG: hypothetical protein WBG08_06640 [Litorimonas sp.]
MLDDGEKQTAREQQERRRLARLIDALPVLSGFASPDGHLIRTHPQTQETFLWSLPAFAYAHDSVTQIVNLCERAAGGERVQVERAYLKRRDGQADVFGRGLVTVFPVQDDKEQVDEIAFSLVDCDEAGIAKPDTFAKSRLAEANARIESLLSLAQTVIEVSQPQIGRPGGRDRLTDRLDALAAVIDDISDPDRADMPIEDLARTALQNVPEEIRAQNRVQLMLEDGVVPIAFVPLVLLILSELCSNALEHGAWRNSSGRYCGRVSLQSELLDIATGRVLRLHWIEDGGPKVSAALGRGFGFTLGERLFPQITDGRANLLNTEDGLSWTFELPVPAPDVFDFDGGFS